MSEQITSNPSVPSQVVAEVKFPQFINNLGIIPTSYKDSMSYYETLAWLCKYLEETVIPTVNQNGNAVQELQSLYIELNSYVTHYFDNLDVQDEINNKLDEMASTGQLQELVNNIFNTLNTKIDTTKNDLQIEITSVASGSPAGVYATVSALTTADPNHSKIYLVEADGKWYYYNTSESEWTAGGTYQSTGLTIENSVINNIMVSQESVDKIVQAPLVKSSAYNINNGSIVSSPSADRTDYIFVESQIVDCFFDSDVTYCACFDINKDFIRTTTPLVQSEHHKRFYLGNDVKYIGINFLHSNDSFKTIKFLNEYVFDYDYEIVDYYWQDGRDSNLAYSKKYSFDFELRNIAICGYPHIAIGREFNKTADILTGFNAFNYFSSITAVNDKYAITVPFLMKSTYKIFDTFFGYKPKNYSACIYGTSISNINNEGKYPNPLEGLITATDLSITAISGGRYTGNLKNAILADTNSYDVVFLEGCINDWYYSASIEDLRDSMYDIFQNLFTRTNKIVMIMDFTGRNYNSIDDSTMAKNDNDIYLQDYLEEFRKICSSYGVDVITNEGCYINEFYSDLYVDQIHQSLKGGLKFAIYLWKTILKNQIIDFTNVNKEEDFEDFLTS